MTKSENLLDWMKCKKVFSGVDVREWGLMNFCISADRVARRFAEEGKIRKLSNEEIFLLGLGKKTKIAWWEVK